MQSDRKDLDQLRKELQKPLTDASPVSFRVMQAVLATRAEKRAREEKEPLNVRALDLTNIDMNSNKLSAEFFNSIRNHPEAEKEMLIIVVKDVGHYFVAAIDYSKQGPQFAVLDAAGDPRGSQFSYRLTNLRDETGKYYFRRGFVANGDKHEGAQEDLNSWFPQKDQKSCPGFTADHAFKLSKMPNFFRDLERRISDDSVNTDNQRPSVHFVNWIFLAKKLVQRAQSERWQKEYNRLHPESIGNKDILSVGDHFQKIQQEALQMVDQLSVSDSYENIIAKINQMVGLTDVQYSYISAQKVAEDKQDSSEVYSKHLTDVEHDVEKASSTVELGQIMKDLSPADCVKVFEQFPDKIQLIESIFEYEPCLVVDLNDEQKHAVFPLLANQLMSFVDCPYMFSVVMRDCPESMRSQVFENLTSDMSDWYMDNYDLIELKETARVLDSKQLTEFCSKHQEIIKSFLGERPRESLGDFSKLEQDAIVAGVTPVVAKTSQVAGSMFGSRRSVKDTPVPTSDNIPKPGNNN